MDKEEFLEHARQANKNEIDQTKISDLTDKDSAFYKSPKAVSEEKTPEIPQKPKDPFALQNIRTFKADVADTVKAEDLSVSKIAIKEVARKRANEESPTDSSSKIVYVVIGILAGLLLLGGIGAIVYSLFFVKNKKEESVIVPIVVKKLFMRSDSETKILLSNKTSRDIFNEINKEIKNPSKANGIRKIIFEISTNGDIQNATTDNILESLESKIPEELARSLKKETFSGINFIDGEGEPFFIIFGESYDSLFSGMLKWEEDLSEDMSTLFGKDPNATTTDKYIFKDSVIENKDVRILFDKDKKIRFFYSLLENNIVFFGNSQRTFKEVLTRIREAKLVK